MRIVLFKLVCERCGHKWVPTQEEITMCPKCKSKHWHSPRENNQGRRPSKKTRSKR